MGCRDSVAAWLEHLARVERWLLVPTTVFVGIPLVAVGYAFALTARHCAWSLLERDAPEPAPPLISLKRGALVGAALGVALLSAGRLLEAMILRSMSFY